MRDPFVAAGVAGTLVNMARTAAAAVSIIAEGGCELAVEAVRAHSAWSAEANVPPAEPICLLIHLSHFSGDAADRIVRAGGMRVILAAMRSLCRTESFLRNALGAVLACFNAAIGVVAPEEYLQTVRAIATAQPSSAMVLARYLLLLRRLLDTVPEKLDLAAVVELAALALAGSARTDETVVDHAVTAIDTAVDAAGRRQSHEWAAPVAMRFIAAGGVPHLLAAVSLHMSNSAIARRGCLLLAGLASAHSAAVDAAAGARCCVAALRAHSDDLAVFAIAATLTVVLSVSKEAKAVMLEGGIISLFTATCSKVGIGNSFISSAWHALTILAVDEHGAEQAVAARLPQLAAATLRRLGSDTYVARGACGVLGALVPASKSSSSVSLAWLDTTFIPVLLSTWKQHPNDDFIVRGARLALAWLCGTYANAQAVEAAGGIDLAVAALGRHAPSIEAARLIASMLEELAATLGHRSKFVDAGAPTALALPLRHNLRHPQLATCICNALFSKSHRDKDCSKGVGPALVHFFDLAACSGVVGTGVAEVLAPAVLNEIERTREASSSDVCRCKTFALLNILAASKAGAVAFTGMGTGTRIAVDVMRGRLAVCAGAQRYARAAVCHLAAHPQLRAQLLAGGAVKPLLGALKGEGELVTTVQQLSLSAIVRLACDAAGQAAIVAAGGAQTLCGLLQRTSSRIEAGDGGSGSSSGGSAVRTPPFSSIAGDEGAVVDALRTVANLARSPDAQADALKAGLLPLLVSFLYTGNSPTVVQAGCAALRAYAMGEGCDRGAVDAGAVAALVDVLQDFSAEAAVVEEACAVT